MARVGSTVARKTWDYSDVAERRRGTPTPPTDTTVLDRDWTVNEVVGATYERTLFVDVDMADLLNRGSTFRECVFRGVEFNASTHTEAAFLNCTFVRCEFFDATFTDCKLVGSVFDGGSFDVLRVSGGDWSFVGLPGADLRRASFTGLRMNDVDLTGAKCAGAAFTEVDLSDAWVHGADFTGADLRGSDLSGIDITSATLTGARIEPEQAVAIALTLGFRIG